MHLEALLVHQRDDASLFRQRQRLPDLGCCAWRPLQARPRGQALLLRVEQRPPCEVEVVGRRVQQCDDLHLGRLRRVHERRDDTHQTSGSSLVGGPVGSGPPMRCPVSSSVCQVCDWNFVK